MSKRSEYEVCKDFVEGNIGKWDAIEECGFLTLGELMRAIERHGLTFSDDNTDGSDEVLDEISSMLSE